MQGLADNATELWPEHTYREEDAEALVPGEWTQVRVGIAGFHHVFRAGSRIRVVIDTPGDTRSEWRFELAEFDGDVSYDIGASAEHPSSIVLPVLEGVAKSKGYRRIFAGVPAIGGRFSALSNFGLVPAAAIGANRSHASATSAVERRVVVLWRWAVALSV